MINASIPMPVQIILDDVGWWSGRDDSSRNGPFRTGIARDHVPADYAALAALGRGLGVRPLAAMILCEWDTRNILRDLPSATWMGAKWDNSRWVGPWIDEAAQILRDNRQHIEISLHGLAHEYWGPDGKASRAEFHDMGCNLRPRGQVHAHLEFYARLLEQHNLGPFPRTYAPTAGRHRFGDGEAGFDAVLRDAGVEFTSTPFSVMGFSRPTQWRHLGVDCSVVTIDRGPDLQRWYAIGCDSLAPVPGPICGIHWPNILHIDPARNLEVVERWIALLKPYDHRLDRMLAPDAPAAWTQFVYQQCASLSADERGLTIDCAGVDRLPPSHLSDEFSVKVAVPPGTRFSANDASLAEARFDAEGGHHVLRVRRTPGAPNVRVEWTNG